MEFMQRGSRPNQPVAPTNSHNTQAAGPAPKSKGPSTAHIPSAVRYAYVVLLFSVSALIVALVAFLAFSGKGGGEAKLIDDKKYQAVFLNGGQVYFGKIRGMNSKVIGLTDIYYLRVNQQVQPGQQASANDVSLVKLGCELHGPQDQMVINREQVVFWENLKDDGQVAKAVKQYQEQNPNGQKCDTATQSQQGSDGSAPATATPAPAPASNNTNKKP